MQWLIGLGVESARRNQQYNGATGEEDIVAPIELPSFHIEAKGTKYAKVPKSTLKKWHLQVTNDAKDGSLPIIFHEANGEEVVALFPMSTALAMDFQTLHLQGIVGNSFVPSYYVKSSKFTRKVAESLGQVLPYIPLMHVFKVDPDRYFIALDGEIFVEKALEYEKKKKAL